ncbi:MAG: biotin transporter BioY [Cyanobacteriota bacterium]|nr:biotin transporter BioY [Cyanobacteriota bacterium]
MKLTREILWAIVGLILTIGGTFLEAHVANPSAIWAQENVKILSLGVTYQIGAVLLVGCLGGKNAAVISQIAYIFLGLTLLPIFSQGGGFGYLKEPSFGYLLGFIPGAWVCGKLADRAAPKLELLAFSCLNGLLAIHLVGLSYLILSKIFTVFSSGSFPILWAIKTYSISPLPGQMAVVCAVTVLAYLLRRAMFY